MLDKEIILILFKKNEWNSEQYKDNKVIMLNIY